MGTTAQNVGRAVSGVFKTLSQITRGLANALDTAVDFAYVRVFGLPFIVLGYRGTGKTTLLARLRDQIADIEEFDPDPTAAGGDPVPAFRAPVGANGGSVRVKPRRDVGGEYSMWETDWLTLYREAKPRGIIYLIDHTNVFQHKDGLNYVLQMLDEERAQKPIKVFLLLVNKSDLWQDEMTMDEILEDYRNEVRRLKSQAERLRYDYMIRESSALTGDSLNTALTDFFDAVRPRSQQKRAEGDA